MKTDPEKGMECSIDNNVVGGWNQAEDADSGYFLYRKEYVIVKNLILWEIGIHIEIALSTTDAKYIALFKAMRDILPFVGLMKDIIFIL